MEFDRMVEAKDYQALKACGEKMKEILNDLDKLIIFGFNHPIKLHFHIKKVVSKHLSAYSNQIQAKFAG